ncbi:MAG TPA: PLP-dependent aminotransferase family protein [Mogibacterium sp.]|nr:PLP-dependent aminotransferase family protein [Mogibacterium sp.]
MQLADRMSVIRGSVIRDVATEIASRNNPNLIKLSGGLPDEQFFPMKELQAAAEKIFADPLLFGEALQYGLTKGDTELIELIIERLNRNEKLGINFDNIIICTGCQQGISMACTALLNDGETILIEKPSYLDGLNAALPYNPNIVGVETDDQGIRIDKLEEALNAHPDTKLVYVIPNFQNPTGKAWPLERRKAFLELLKKYPEVKVLEDNPYGEIRFRGEHVPCLKALDDTGQVIYLGSFSKILCPGLRIAYIVSDSKELIDRIEEIKEGLDLQSNQFSQVHIREYMKMFDLDEHVRDLCKVYKGRCDALIEMMKNEFPVGVTFTIPDGGLFLYVTCPENFDTGKMLKDALDAEVSYIPGASFNADGSGKNTMRLNFSANDVPDLQEGIRRLAGVFKAEIAKQDK